MLTTSRIAALTALALSWPAAAQEHVLQRLESSPRHHEWLEVKVGDRTIHSFLVFPEVSTKATAVVVIHENRGLTDWVRGVADQLAEAGYIAIAPDLLSGMAPGGGRTKDFPTSDAAREAIGQLKPEDVVTALHAVTDHVAKLPAANGMVAVAGYCWGGGQTFRFATQRKDLAAAFVFYGAFQHTREELAAIQAPVYGFYGGDDARINATIPGSEALMKELGKKYEPVIYEGAGHGFLRAGEEATASEANRKAREQAWARWKEILAAL
jgi:carboxymethylenebutenolidase